MSHWGPVVCYYRCGRCKEWFERQKDRTVFFSTYTSDCPDCGKRNVWPYEKHFPGDGTYPLPNE